MAKTIVQGETLFADDKTTTAPVNMEKSRSKPPAKRKSTKKSDQPTQQVVVHKPHSQPTAPKTLLQVCAEAARDPKVDVAKMRELLALAREEEERRAEMEFNIALAEAQGKMPRLARDKKADRFKYLLLETVTKELDPLIKEYGFNLSFGMSESSLENHYRITAVLAHKGGHKRHYFIDLPADIRGLKGGENKTPVQGVGSTISYGRRYLTLMIFNIAVVGEDDDGRGAKEVATITPEQAEELISMCAERRITKEQFTKAARVESIDLILATRFEAAKQWIEQKPIP